MVAPFPVRTGIWVRSLVVWDGQFDERYVISVRLEVVSFPLFETWQDFVDSKHALGTLCLTLDM